MTKTIATSSIKAKNGEVEKGILVKTLKISDETHSELSTFGQFGDTYEDILKRLMKEHKEMKALLAKTKRASGKEEGL